MLYIYYNIIKSKSDYNSDNYLFQSPKTVMTSLILCPRVV